MDLDSILARIHAAGWVVDPTQPNHCGRERLARLLGVSTKRARGILQQLSPPAERTAAKTNQAAETGLDDQILRMLKRPGGEPTIEEIADRLDHGPTVIAAAMERLKKRGYNVAQDTSDRGGLRLEPIAATIPRVPALTHDLSEYEGKWFRFGVTGDKHLGNMHSRLDVMKLLYDLYEAEGITTVYDTGNWIDGECRFNKGELLVHGLDCQIDYWIEHHPKRAGITTHFVAGDDHEGWYQQRECLEIGRYAMLRAQQEHREDLKYLGYAEALVELKASEGSRFMMVNHPGGGSAYATSYKAQKYAESLQGGEKPAVVLEGHYHKFNVGYPREVWIVDTGTCCDQTLFMRKRQIQAHVGGSIVELMQAPDGRIVRFRVEFLPFYDRGFYEQQRRRFGLPSKLQRKNAA
jgi:biotin operon repressor